MELAVQLSEEGSGVLCEQIKESVKYGVQIRSNELASRSNHP